MAPPQTARRGWIVLLAIQVVPFLLIVASATAYGLLRGKNGGLRRASRVCCALVIAISFIGCLGSGDCIIWDGGYR
jgi:hypothetical protein